MDLVGGGCIGPAHGIAVGAVDAPRVRCRANGPSRAGHAVGIGRVASPGRAPGPLRSRTAPGSGRVRPRQPPRSLSEHGDFSANPHATKR